MSSGPIDIESRTDNPSSGLVLGRPHLTGELNADKTRGIVHVAFQTESSRDNRHWNRGPCFLSHPDRVFLPSGGKESSLLCRPRYDCDGVAEHAGARMVLPKCVSGSKDNRRTLATRKR